MKLSSILIFGALSASLSRAQSTVVEWNPSAWQSADFGATVLAGYFFEGVTSDGYEPDVIVIADGTLGLAVAPATVQHGFLSTTLINDMVVKALSTRDGVLTVGASGLQELEWNDTMAEWDVTTHNATTWANARAIRLGDLNSTGSLDAVGLGSGTHTVLVAMGNGAGYGSTTSFTTVSAANHIELANWDGLGEQEIVVVTDGGVEVYESDGTSVATFPWPYSPLRIAVFPKTDAANDRVALIVDDPSTAVQYLTLWDSGGTEGPWGLGTPEVYAASAGDWDADGDYDLFLSQRSDTAFLRLENRRKVGTTTTTEDTFGLGFSEEHHFGNQDRDPAWSNSDVGLADFDLDGDLDVLAIEQGNWDGQGMMQVGVDYPSGLVLVPNDEVDHRERTVRVVDVHLDPVGNPTTDHEVTLRVHAPVCQPALGTNEVHAVELTVWRQDFLGAPVSNLTRILTGQRTNIVGCTIDVTFPLGQPSIPFSDVYPLTMRTVVYDTMLDTITSRGPANFGVYSHATAGATIRNLQVTNYVRVTPSNYVPGKGGGADGGGYGGGLRTPPLGSTP